MIFQQLVFFRSGSVKRFVWSLLIFFVPGMPLEAVSPYSEGDAQVLSAREERAYAIGELAYFFFYPLIIMELTRQQSTVTRVGMNQFFHSSGFPPAADKLVVRLNADALYSMAWVDLRSGRQVLTVPAMEKHAYVFQLLDAWSDVFASPGTRVTGSSPASFALVPRCWQGVLPAGMKKIECPTDLVWIIGRIGLDSDADVPAVRELQTGFTLVPLSSWGDKSAPQDSKSKIDYSLPAPVEQIDALSMENYFDMAMKLLETTSVHDNDWSMMTELAGLGIVAGGTVNALEPAVKTGLKRGFDRAIEFLKQGLRRGSERMVNGWYVGTNIGTYGTDYFTRALIAREGLGALTPQDTVYTLTYTDGEGQPLDGKNNYKLHFASDKLPPVGAYWSITLYTPEGFFSENKLNRNALRSRDPLAYNRDGSLDIYIQHKEPKKNRLNNWLPAPAGCFNLAVRLVRPTEDALYGAWRLPGVKREVKEWQRW